jgi:hypothetical protein
MKSIKLDTYKLCEDIYPKIVIKLDWYKGEDTYRQLYRVRKPRFKKEQMKCLHEANLNRYKWFFIRLTLGKRLFCLDFRLNKVGYLCYGRDLSKNAYKE